MKTACSPVGNRNEREGNGAEVTGTPHAGVVSSRWAQGPLGGPLCTWNMYAQALGERKAGSALTPYAETKPTVKHVLQFLLRTWGNPTHPCWCSFRWRHMSGPRYVCPQMCSPL